MHSRKIGIKIKSCIKQRTSFETKIFAPNRSAIKEKSALKTAREQLVPLARFRISALPSGKKVAKDIAKVSFYQLCIFFSIECLFGHV